MNPTPTDIEALALKLIDALDAELMSDGYIASGTPLLRQLRQATLSLSARVRELDLECQKSMEEIANLRNDNAKLEEALKVADAHAVKIEALLDPHIDWKEWDALSPQTQEGE